MSTEIIDHRKPTETYAAGVLSVGRKFDWNGDIFMVIGYQKRSVEVVHLKTGGRHYIDENEPVETVSVEIHVKAIP